MRRIYAAIAIGLSTILMACGPRPEPAIKVVTQTVNVPVPTACIDASAVPVEPARVGDRLNGQAAHDADLLASSALTLRQWGRELRALIGPCTKTPGG